MKLRMICENIRKTDFYDFYALAYVYQDLKTSTGVDPTYKKEIAQTLKETAEYIFNDHMHQLFILICGRLVDADQLGSGNQFVFKKYGIRITQASLDNDSYKFWPFVNINDLHKLSLSQKTKLIGELLQNRTQYSASAGQNGVWENLAHDFIQLAKTNTNNLNALIIAIDSIYGMTHHGGQILDHFDESGWLENALNTRTLTSPKNLLFHASPHIRELLTSASIGIPRHEPISPLQELQVLLTRIDNQLGLFGYSYKIINNTTFEFKQKIRLTQITIGNKKKKRVITDWSDENYDEWGKTKQHNYANDKEAIFTIFGKLAAQTITLYDTNHQEVETLDLPEAVRDTDNSIMNIAWDIARYASTDNTTHLSWKPIQGNPNPPK